MLDGNISTVATYNQSNSTSLYVIYYMAWLHCWLSLKVSMYFIFMMVTIHLLNLQSVCLACVITSLFWEFWIGLCIIWATYHTVSLKPRILRHYIIAIRMVYFLYNGFCMKIRTHTQKVCVEDEWMCHPPGILWSFYVLTWVMWFYPLYPCNRLALYRDMVHSICMYDVDDKNKSEMNYCKNTF